MYKLLLENLNIQPNNVDQIYIENLKKWKNFNSTLNDEDFIKQELAYLKNIDTNILSKADVKKKEIYSTYLSKIKSKFPWDLEKLYKRYLEDRKLYMTGLILIKLMNYEDLINKLVIYKTHYYYFFDKLSTNDKIELNGDFIDQLEVLRDKKNIPTKFKMYLQITINEIKKHYELYELKQIDFLKDEIVSNENPFPMFFTTPIVYKCFLEYTSKHIIDYHIDYSFLIQKLLSLKLIHNHSHNDYMQFLFRDMKLINEKDFENFLYKKEKKLYILKKSYSVQRENNFLNIFGQHI